MACSCYWQPEVISDQLFDPPERELVPDQVLRHADWLRLDRGSLALSDAIDAATRRTGLQRG